MTPIRTTSYPTTLTVLSIFGAILCTIAVAFVVSSGVDSHTLTTSLSVAGAIVGLLVALGRPMWLFPLVAALSPLILAMNVLGAQAIPADFVIGCILLTLLTRRPHAGLSVGTGRIAIPYLVFVAACIFTFPVDGYTDFGMVRVVQRVEYLLLFLATAALLQDPNWIRRTVDAYIVSAATFGLVTIAFVARYGIGYGGQAVLFLNKNNLASFLMIGFVLAVARVLIGPMPRRRRWIAILLILAIALTLTGSRGAWLGAIVGLGLLAVSSSFVSLLRYVAVAAVILVVGNALLPQQLVRSDELKGVAVMTATGNLTATTVQTRLAYWHDALDIIDQHPVTGVGVGQYYANGYHQFSGATGTLDLASSSPYTPHVIPLQSGDPHNAVLYMWAELGIPGLLAFLWLLAAIVRMAIRATRATRGDANYWIGAGSLAALVGYLIFALTEPIWLRGEGIIFFLLVGITVNLSAHTFPSTRSLSLPARRPLEPALMVREGRR